MDLSAGDAHSSLRSCLVAKLKFQNYYIKRESYMHGILNLDEIKNKLHNLVVNWKTNLMSLIRLWVDTKLLQYICANDGLISINKFISVINFIINLCLIL